MITELMITMLKQGSNGDQILSILNTIIDYDTDSILEPTSDEIDF